MMQFWSKQGIAAKIAITLISIIIVMLFAITTIYTVIQRQVLQDDLEREAQVLLETMAFSIDNDLINLNVASISETAEQIATTEDVESVKVYDDAGRLIVDTSATSDFFSLSADSTGSRLLRQSQIDIMRENGETIAQGAVLINQRAVGAISIALSETRITEGIRQLQVLTVVIGTIATALTTIIAIIFGRNIARPIIRLTELAQNIAQGDYSLRFEETSTDEVGTLGANVNIMTKELLQRENALQKLNQNLEQLVADRTRELIESQQFLEIVLDTIPERVFWKDKDLNYLGANMAFASDAGLSSPSELIGKSDYDMVWGDTEADLFRTDDRAVMDSGNEKIRFEEPQTRADGSLTWLETSKIPLRNNDGDIIGVLGTYADITARKETEQKLRDSQSQLSAILQNAPMIVWALDKEGNFTLSQGQALESVGLQPGQVVGLNALEVYADDPASVEGAKEALGGGTPSYDTTIGDAWFDVRYTPVLDDDGNFDYTIGIAFDISDRKSSEAEREQLIKDLRAAKRIADENSRLKSEFLSMMSHELRTPMNAIEGFTGIILNRMAGTDYNDKTERYVGKIRTNSKRLLGLINDFLDLSRIESGRLELASLPMKPRDMAQNWHDNLVALTENKGLEFDVSVDEAIPETIYGDEESISKIAINLLGNAIKFTEEGKVSLTLERHDEQQFAIIVSDTGIGIPPHAREYIFDEFRQVDMSSKRSKGGTGLGLSIVDKLAREMGGSVSLDSMMGMGSTFVVLLPLTESAQETQITETV